MRALLDNNLPPALARALDHLSQREYQVPVFALRDKFDRDTPDVEWIHALDEEGGWIVISHDRFKKGSLEKEALRRAGLKVFVLAKQWNKHSFWDNSVSLIRWWPTIIRTAEVLEGGAAFDVPWKLTGQGKLRQANLHN